MSLDLNASDVDNASNSERSSDEVPDLKHVDPAPVLAEHEEDEESSDDSQANTVTQRHYCKRFSLRMWKSKKKPLGEVKRKMFCTQREISEAARFKPLYSRDSSRLLDKVPKTSSHFPQYNIS